MFSVMAAHSGSDRAVATSTIGYGEGGYGTTAYGGSTQVDTTLQISPDGTSNVTQTEATLSGTVSDFGGASSVTVRFEYRPIGQSRWSVTSEQSLFIPKTFTQRVDGLSSATDYEFRVSARSSDGDASTSSPATFTTKRHTLIIDGSVSPETLSKYSFTVDGNVEKSDELGSVQANDSISGRTISGEVLGGRDGYRFTGDVTDFEVVGDPVVYLDGNSVDPSELGDTTYPNTILFDGSRASRRRATYEATMNGKVAKSSLLGTIQTNDSISGSSVRGDVFGGKDGYRFTGEITKLSVDGTMTVSLTEGTSSTAESGSLPNTFVVDGSETPEMRAAYTITVSGSIKKSSDIGSIQPNDEVSGAAVSGSVFGGRDAYRYSGDITRIDITGPAVIRFDATDG